MRHLKLRLRMEMNPTDGDFAATMKSFMASPRFGTSDESRGRWLTLPAPRPVSLPAPTFQRLTATERNA
jgi:hypothetical protein